MKQSGYRTVFHIYLIFFLSLLGTILVAGVFFFLLITVQKPDGTVARSDWPGIFAKDFKEQIIFIDDKPQISRPGMTMLQDNMVGVQVLSPSGAELYSFQKPEQAPDNYTGADLIRLVRTGETGDSGITVFAELIANDGQEYVCLLYFPMDISKVTMYFNGDRFAGGKSIILPVASALILLVSMFGFIYGFWMTNAVKRLGVSIRDISCRSYLPVRKEGAFRDLYENLNALDSEIRAGDMLQKQTDRMREEWIANITHDLKTPLSPIRGYAEMLYGGSVKSEEQCRRYAGIMLKNSSYMGRLIDDLKLTYQLKNNMLPVNRRERNLVRFLKELIIDILNDPDYESRTISFESESETILWPFDETLMTRAFRNLIINAFEHGESDTEVTLRVTPAGEALSVALADNGKGLTDEESRCLFERYYRGKHTEQKTEGTGLGLAIAKEIVELHQGTISVNGVPGTGTTFHIKFHYCAPVI